MASSTKISVSDLDFDGIKANLKAFLQSQDTFTDYNFEGSGLNILLDVLAYNTHYNGFYSNMVANEMFLDSAAIRKSVVSLAKHLGYTPLSSSSPKATVNVTWASDPGITTLPVGSVFTTSINDKQYNFVTLSSFDVGATGSSWEATNVDIFEGARKSISFVVDSKDPNQKFIIPGTNVDTKNGLIVKVQTAVDDTTGFTDTWNLATDINTVDGTTTIFYLQEVDEGKFEVYFGDGIVGKQPADGNVINITYFDTNKTLANGAGTSDKPSAPSFSFGSSVVSVVSAAAGGAEPETINSIKHFAPLQLQAQERAVTAEDYKVIIARDYPDVESVIVWGGEDNDPPAYGKVFISLKPVSGKTISTADKKGIINDVVKNRNVVSITPEIVDPDFTYLLFTTNVAYNTRQTANSAGTIASLVNTVITNYVNDNLDKFDRKFRYSEFSTLVDKAESSILNSSTVVQLQKHLTPISTAASYKIKFSNPIFHPEDGHIPVISSNSFTYFNPTKSSNVTTFLDDDGKGKIRLYEIINSVKTYFNNEIGTINYTTGEVNLIQFAPVITNADAVEKIKITAVPTNLDAVGSFNQILTLDSNDSGAIVITTSTEIV